MKKVLLALGVLLVMAASLVLWGSKFATGTVRAQLAAQRITFPDKAALEEDNPALVKYADQQVDSGDEAKAYAAYIEGHLKNTADGKTYSEVSSAYQQDRTNQTLAGQRQALFMGETLRGLLLNAWGWGLIGTIAFYAAIALYVAGGAAVVAAVAMPVKTTKKRSKK
jgi:hypothetical protein